jgi:hypothetical protein
MLKKNNATCILWWPKQFYTKQNAEIQVGSLNGSDVLITKERNVPMMLSIIFTR